MVQSALACLDFPSRNQVPAEAPTSPVQVRQEDAAARPIASLGLLVAGCPSSQGAAYTFCVSTTRDAGDQCITINSNTLLFQEKKLFSYISSDTRIFFSLHVFHSDNHLSFLACF